MQNIPRPEHPRPDFVRPDWLNLNGEWEFAFDDAKAGVAEKWFNPGKHFDGKIVVPFCYQCEMSGVNIQDKHEVMWYRRSFEVPASMKGNKWKMIKHTGLFLYDRCYEGNKLVGQTMTGRYE